MPCPKKYKYRPRPAKKAAMKLVRVGSGGLQLMTYKGFYEIYAYKGLGTGKSYPFGMNRLKGYIDTRDVESFLEIVEDTQWVFEEA